jgi:uncharacterized protein
VIGVLANAAGIVIGALLGLALRKRVSAETTSRAEAAMGYCTLLLGIKMALRFQSVGILLISVGVGCFLGSALRIQERLEALASSLQKRFAPGADSGFAVGFLTSSILFCTGAMAIVGSIQSGAQGDNEVLFAKALIDTVIAMSFASIYGAGVVFSAIPVLLYEGAIALTASGVGALTRPHVLAEISGVGGILVIMIGVTVAGLRKIQVSYFLPALPLAVVAALASGPAAVKRPPAPRPAAVSEAHAQTRRAARKAAVKRRVAKRKPAPKVAATAPSRPAT